MRIFRGINGWIYLLCQTNKTDLVIGNTKWSLLLNSLGFFQHFWVFSHKKLIGFCSHIESVASHQYFIHGVTNQTDQFIIGKKKEVHQLSLSTTSKSCSFLVHLDEHENKRKVSDSLFKTAAEPKPFPKGQIWWVGIVRGPTAMHLMSTGCWA